MSRRLVVALFVLAGALTPMTTATATAQQPSPSYLLELDRQTAAVAPGENFVVSVRAAGAPAGSKIRVEVHRKIGFRSDFQRILDSEEVGTRLAIGVTQDAAAVTTITVPTTELQLQDGVYPVTIELVDAKSTRLDRLVTYLIRLPANPGDDLALDVAVVMPVTATPSLRPDRTTAVANSARNAAQAARLLANSPSAPVTLAVSPELVDGLAASSDTSDHELLARLNEATADDELVSVPYSTIDAAAWWNDGLLGPLADAVDRGNVTLRERLAPPTTTTWVADREFNPGLARWLHDRGVQRVVVPEESLSPLGQSFNFTLTQPFELAGIDGMQAIAADAGLGAHVGATGDAVLDAHRLLADLAILYYDQPGATRRGAVVTLPSHRSIDPEFFNPLLNALSATPKGIFRASTVDSVFDNVPRADDSRRRDGTGEPLRRELVPDAASDLEDFPDRLRRATNDVANYQSLVGPDSTRTDALDRARLVAGDRTLDESGRNQYLEEIAGFVAGEMAKITAPERQTIRFTARDGTVALALQNLTGYPVAVRLQLRGSKLDFPDHPDRVVERTLSGETTRIELRVRTRSSGDSPLDVTISTLDGRVLGNSRVTVRSTAFSGLGIVLSVGAGGFLLVWWGRHITREKRRRPRPRHAVGSHGNA